MAPTNSGKLSADRAEAVRARLLTALHVGRLRPGDRVPSVRRLAYLTGVNPKTVHRAYTELACEGFLDVRPGSGTFVSDRRTGAASGPPVSDLVHALHNMQTEAKRLGLDAATLAGFFHTCLSGDWSDVTLGVVECNLEQIATIRADLDRDLRVRVKPISLTTLRQEPCRTVGELSSIVTTDCHWSEVAELARPFGAATHAVALDQQFPRHLLDLAAGDEVVLVVRDPRFGPVFARLLEQLVEDPRTLRRIRVVDERTAPTVLHEAVPGTWVHISPLVRQGFSAIPRHVRRVRCDWHVTSTALEGLRVGLAIDRILAQTT